ncbi:MULTISPECIES: AAA family ATPase [Bradyrhizobium]|uniref:AAA domain-containing protein n=2 Tax=Bradyrhizobium TaxID=374 RepID=A0ABY0QG92_9BRAD|nr:MULTISPECIES: AAA family ATPase [Bradyrhizobium]SDK28438.1 AAA domain-containing protein [Bradyrhizobium ottawaense]SEE42185.1 AAA domain-containing protein [Bradyrhizobium lablabi]
MHVIKNGKVYNDETGNLTKTSVENGITYDDDDNVVVMRALSFKTFAEFADEEPKNWLIEGVIALDEDSTWFGKDGGGKSTLIDDIAVHVASRRDWRGHKFNRDETESCGVIIFATERAALHRRRLEAYKIRDNLPGNLPIAVIAESINLCDPDCVEIVSDTIYDFERKNNCTVGLVIIDSWSKALGGCDENLAATQNYACGNLTKIRDRHFNNRFHFLTVGHPGKDGTKGERGNSAKRAHMDLAVCINKGVAEVVKANDIVLGALATFEPQEFTVTRGAEKVGTYDIPERSFTVSILAPYSPAAAPVTREARPLVFEPTGKNAEALAVLKRVIASHGQDGAVSMDLWKAELFNADLLPGKNPRVPFARFKNSLRQHIIADNNFVRLNSQSQQTHRPSHSLHP